MEFQRRQTHSTFRNCPQRPDTVCKTCRDDLRTDFGVRRREKHRTREFCRQRDVNTHDTHVARVSTYFVLIVFIVEFSETSGSNSRNRRHRFRGRRNALSRIRYKRSCEFFFFFSITVVRRFPLVSKRRRRRETSHRRFPHVDLFDCENRPRGSNDDSILYPTRINDNGRDTL